LKNRLNLEATAFQPQKLNKLQILDILLLLDFLLLADLPFSFLEEYEKQSLSYQGKLETMRCYASLICHRLSRI
jgi:hypothetical protein